MSFDTQGSIELDGFGEVYMGKCCIIFLLTKWKKYNFFKARQYKENTETLTYIFLVGASSKNVACDPCRSLSLCFYIIYVKALVYAANPVASYGNTANGVDIIDENIYHD